MALMNLDHGSGNLQKQIYDSLRESILSGYLAGGSTLPSSRRLAGDLDVSRNTVNAAYSRLEGEGYILIHPSSGVRIREGLVIGSPRPPSGLKPQDRDTGTPAGFSERRRDLIDFRSGIPALSGFPVACWSRIVRQVLSEVSPDTFGYSQPEGRDELRRAVCDYAIRHRGVKAEPDQVLITAGTTQAVGLLTRLLLVPEGVDGPRLTCAVEEPLTSDIKEIIRGSGGRAVAVAVDRHGFNPDLIPPGTNPAAIYVTPSHQFPLGMVMPLERRLALAAFARETGCWIIEDDYDSEFRYSGLPLPSLQGLVPDRTIYIGTFSKTLSPALRTAYLILPPELTARGRRLKWFTDLHNPTIDQLALARFIDGGYYGRHLSAMKKIYRRNREILTAALGSAEILGDSAGIHLAVRFPGVRFDRELCLRLESVGVKVYPVAEHAEVPESWQDTIILGFGYLDHADLKKGAEILVDSVTDVTDKNRESVLQYPSKGNDP